jgi:hypothetical protein
MGRQAKRRQQKRQPQQLPQQQLKASKACQQCVGRAPRMRQQGATLPAAAQAAGSIMLAV